MLLNRGHVMFQKFKCLGNYNTGNFKAEEIHRGIVINYKGSLIEKMRGFLPPFLQIFDPIEKEWVHQYIDGWEPVDD